ncbi:MAG: energy transducer TonB [Acidobacteriota bacterium]|nr:energy transducer TonB [Acidobacteriota bacterium]
MKTLTLTLALSFMAVAASAGVLADWSRDQASIEAQLQQKQYAQARKASIKLTNRMLDRLGGSAEASRLLAETASLRGSAEEGLGNTDDAIWYRQVASALDPPKAAQSDEKPLQPPIVAFSLPLSSNIKPPVATRRREPDRPAIINALGESLVTVEVVIDVDGIVRQPRIVQSPAPSVAYAALEAIRQWRFRPGTMDGKPVPVVFNLTFNFR